MALQNGQDLQQMQPQQQPQGKPQKTFMQRALWREKWIIVLCALYGLLGLYEVMFTDKLTTLSDVFTGVAITFVMFTILNFTVVAWLVNVFVHSKRASEQFWSQK